MNVQDFLEGAEDHDPGIAKTTENRQRSGRTGQHLEYPPTDHDTPEAANLGTEIANGDTRSQPRHPPKGDVATPGNKDGHQYLPLQDREVAYEITPPRDADHDPELIPRRIYTR